MVIKLVTTEKKITKSIINQLPIASKFELKNGKGIGFLRNIRKDIAKALLIESNGDYFIFPFNYTKKDKKFYRRAGKWAFSFNFDSPSLCTEYWAYYQERLKEGDTQIFI